MDTDFRAGLGKTFAHSHVKRYIGPAPIIDLDPQRHKGLGHRIRANILLFTISGYGLAIDRAGGVLATDYILRYPFPTNPAQRAKHFDLLVSDGVGA